ncbi:MULTISPECIES: PcfJ domain-containing protein [unclassified Neglectibacter]|uniref:PcfJ domain-containing protein n=1 Tax=unclassified Neglectibacter TaxID=2632164 RepID=UPI0013720DB2|nr:MULTISPECIES: PcfJ domain-containing protein [unclassified Neglectibacter]
MEKIIQLKNYQTLATEKIDAELQSFTGGRKEKCISSHAAAQVTHFCEESPAFAEVVYKTKRTLSDCCAEVVKDAKEYISDIDVYRGIVRAYFPNADIKFLMNIEINGDAPSEEEMAKAPEKICVAHKVEGQLLLRYTDVERTIYPDRKKPDYTFSDAFYTLFLTENGRQKEYAYAWCQAPYQGYDWRRLPNGTKKLNPTFVYTPNLREVFGEKYYHVDLQVALAGLRRPVPFRRLLDNLKNIPQAEYLVKAGLPILASSVLPDCRAKSLLELTGLGKEYLPAMRESQASFQEIRVVARQNNPRPEELRQLCALRLDGESLRLLEATAQYNTLGRTLAYVQAQWQQAPWQLRRRKLPYFLTLYRDYLNMADALQSDMEKRAILEPRDLKERHDLLSARIAGQKDELENRRFQRAVDSGLYGWAKPYAKEGFCVAYPESRSDFITEGQKLNHCVGAKMYYENHIFGRNMVFFIRKTEAPEKPYFTAEIEMVTGRVRQLYGFGDCSAPKEVRAFTEGFARAAVRWKSTGTQRAAG